MKIDELLGSATSTDVPRPPTSAQLKSHIDRRRKKKWQAAAFVGTGAAASIAVAVMMTSVDVNSDPVNPERVETIDVPPPTPTSTEVTSGRIDRMFLVPPEPFELASFGVYSAEGEINREIETNEILVSNDPDDPAGSGMVSIYFVPDASSIFRIGDPDWDFYEVTREGREVRVGRDPTSERSDAFVRPGGGADGVVVATGVSVTDDDLIALALAAQLDGDLDRAGGLRLVGQLPGSFIQREPPHRRFDSYTMSVDWHTEDSEFRLESFSSSLELVASNLRLGPAEQVEVRGEMGIYVPIRSGPDHAALIWSEDGRTRLLTRGIPRYPGTSVQGGLPTREELVRLAESLRLVGEADFVDSMNEAAGWELFGTDQRGIVSNWFDNAPPAPGFDPSRYVDLPPTPLSDLDERVLRFVECTWIADWIAATESDDGPRRRRAEAVLGDRGDWLVYRSVMERLASIPAENPASARHDQEIEADQEVARRMASATTVDDFDQLIQEIDCGLEAR